MMYLFCIELQHITNHLSEIPLMFYLKKESITTHMSNYKYHKVHIKHPCFGTLECSKKGEWARDMLHCNTELPLRVEFICAS